MKDIFHDEHERRFIYVLEDSRIHHEGEIFYVGQTLDLLERFIQHCKERNDSEKSKRIHSILRSGKLPLMKTVYVALKKNEADFREAYYIEYYREKGEPLTNRTLNISGHGEHGLYMARLEQWEKRYYRRSNFLKRLFDKLLHRDDFLETFYHETK